MKLVVHKQGKLLGDLELGPGVITVGRRPDNDMVLSDRAVSGRHARIVLTRDGVTVQDLGSTNGTLVNGKRIKTQELRQGDVVTMGTYRLEFETGEHVPENTDPPTRILRIDRPGMPPGEVDAQCTRRIRQWRPDSDGKITGPMRQMRLRFLSGANQGRHLDLLSSLTALGEAEEDVVVLVREGDGLKIRLVHAGAGRVTVNDIPLGDEAMTVKNDDVIVLGDVRMLVYIESNEDTMMRTQEWTLE